MSKSTVPHKKPGDKKFSPNNNKTLGPVADLEKHLPAEWWKTLFNSLYLKTDGDVVENERNTITEVEKLIDSVGLRPEHTILDLCCGQGRHSIELHRRGYSKTLGVDRSKYLIRLARKRAQERGFNIAFKEGDARNIRLPESSVDCVVLFGNSFGYFEQQNDDLAVIHSILNILVSEGKVVFDITNGDWMRNHFEPRSWEWIDENHFVCRERSLSNDLSKLISREVVVHAERGVIADQFYAERLYTLSQIKSMLELSNFSNITCHDHLNAESSRSQDLGMMADRMFISAAAPIKTNLKKKTAPRLKNFTVLLGDPSLPDTVKRGGSFNTEDFETVNKLKQALSTLPYDIHYLNKHDQFIEHFQKNPTELVVNFCDEGFYNKASLELHVPALLDILNIKYTGSKPSTLALCYDKSLVRSIAMSMDIPVPLEIFHACYDQAANLPSIFPALIKPNLGDSSIGITKEAVVYNSKSLIAYFDKLKAILPNVPVLIQEYLSGDEYSVGIIGNSGNYTYLPILAVDYTKIPKNLPKILGYESKWLPHSTYWKNIDYLPALLDLETERKLYDYSVMLFERLGCCDYARFDFRADAHGKIKLLEVNPNPGWCWDGKLNLMAQFSGKDYSELLDLIIKSALERYAN